MQTREKIITNQLSNFLSNEQIQQNPKAICALLREGRGMYKNQGLIALR